VWLSLNRGAEYLVQKYGARIARRVAQSPPPIAVDINGRRGYESSELEEWARDALRTAAGRGTPTSEATKVNPVRRAQGIVGQFVDWMNDDGSLQSSRPPAETRYECLASEFVVTQDEPRDRRVILETESQ
jgi:hypothetical protein